MVNMCRNNLPTLCSNLVTIQRLKNSGSLFHGDRFGCIWKKEDFGRGIRENKFEKRKCKDVS